MRYDIGRAPLLDSPFNECRSYVKYFDITRTGGVGVYSDGPVFRPVVRNGFNGSLVGNSVRAWVDAICALAEDPGRRHNLYANAASDVARLAGAGEKTE